MTKSKLILVGPLPPPVHGVTIFTEQLLASSLVDRFNVAHLDTSDHRPMDTVGALDIRNILLGLVSYWHLFKLCIRHRPAVVYVPISQTAIGFLRDSVYLMLPSLIFRSAVVIHMHGGHFGQFYAATNAAMRLCVRMAMRCVERAIVLGEVFKPAFLQWFPDSNIDVIPNGTSLAVPAVEKKLSAPKSGPLTVTFLSNLIPTKGIVEFVMAARAVLTFAPETVFVVVGNWAQRGSPEEARIGALLDKEGLRERICFVGEKRDCEKIEILSATDIYVLPTYYPFEGQPIVILEAMAAGCAVIATAHAAIPETVIDGESGIIVPPRDVNALSAAIRRLIQDRNTLLTMARKSYDRYWECYTVERASERVAVSISKAIR